jgi:cytochrome c553
MRTNQSPTIFGALILLAATLAVPAIGAEGLESKLEICSTCHGQNGEPIDATIPVIWGQQQSFLVKQLHDYRSGDRDNAVMAAFDKSLTQAELRPAAAYFAGKPWPARRVAATPASAPGGMTACIACHQQNFAGGAPAPRLTGQSYEFLVEQMRRFADGERTNNADMVKIMKELSAEQRDAMARYIASL